jgi:hypothetical protein
MMRLHGAGARHNRNPFDCLLDFARSFGQTGQAFRVFERREPSIVVVFTTDQKNEPDNLFH